MPLATRPLITNMHGELILDLTNALNNCLIWEWGWKGWWLHELSWNWLTPWSPSLETTSKHACLRGQATKLKQLLESKQVSLCQTENDKKLAWFGYEKGHSFECMFFFFVFHMHPSKGKDQYFRGIRWWLDCLIIFQIQHITKNKLTDITIKIPCQNQENDSRTDHKDFQNTTFCSVNSWKHDGLFLPSTVKDFIQCVWAQLLATPYKQANEHWMH